MQIIKKIEQGRDFASVMVMPTNNPDIFFVQMTADKQDEPREYCTIAEGCEGGFETLTALLYEDGKPVKASTTLMVEGEFFLVALSNKEGRGWYEGFLVKKDTLLEKQQTPLPYTVQGKKPAKKMRAIKS